MAYGRDHKAQIDVSEIKLFRETLMSNLEMCDIQKKHYEVWIELYHKYAEYYQVDIPKDNFDLTWNGLLVKITLFGVF